MKRPTNSSFLVCLKIKTLISYKSEKMFLGYCHLSIHFRTEIKKNETFHIRFYSSLLLNQAGKSFTISEQTHYSTLLGQISFNSIYRSISRAPQVLIPHRHVCMSFFRLSFLTFVVVLDFFEKLVKFFNEIELQK